MSEPILRIFSYLPNPRVWKALIAAEICGVTVETRGDKPPKLAQWMWDFDAHELSADEMSDNKEFLRVGRRGFTGSLYKTDAFLLAHPFGTVPAAFSPDGKVGIFESNSILRAVARHAPNEHILYGDDAYDASRIDSFLDASLVFAREAQVYLLSISAVTIELYDRMKLAYEFYLDGIDSTLSNTEFISGDELSIADIAFACDFAQFLRERTLKDDLKRINRPPMSENVMRDHPRAYRHLIELAQRPEFAKHLSPLTDNLPVA